MSNEHEDYVLGQDVTGAAVSKSRAGSAVLSVRLTADELAAIEAVAIKTGKNLSQVVREAVRNCLQYVENDYASSRPTVTISIAGRRTSSTYGPPRNATLGATAGSEETFIQIGDQQLTTTG